MSRIRRTMRAGLAVAMAGCVAAALIGAPVASGHRDPRTPPGPAASAIADTYSTTNVGTLAVKARGGVLANDGGGQLQLISHTDPAHGSLRLQPNGAFHYVPAAGFTGDDTFTYTVANAVHLWSTHLPSLGSFGGVNLTGGGFGSSLYPVPGSSDEYYGLEDRGPNVSPASGAFDVEPIPSYDPAIGEFRLDGDGRAVLIRKIHLRDATGHPYSGLVNSLNPTGETIEDLSGRVLATDPDGYDPEGLVAMRDGTFWVSDEYGPFVTHFDSRGRQIGRLSPLDGSLPRELLNRVPNRGLEGLTVTPDGHTLVAMMQSALQQTDLNGANAKKIAPLRIVTYDLRSHALHEYLYLLHDPATTGTAVSELTALSDTTFLVDERDGNFPAVGGFKKLFTIDLTGATDVGPSAHVAGATYNAAGGGLLIGAQTIEKATKGETTAQAQATLQGDGITPVTSTQYVDIDALLLSLDPQARFFDHDKVEGVAALDGGRQIVVSNDSDFGISGIADGGPPYQLQAKIDPATGQQDDGEYLAIDTTKLDPSTSAAQTSTATVTIHVNAG
jgi:Esterase-like activity of phytase/Bacterial Ig domain